MRRPSSLDIDRESFRVVVTCLVYRIRQGDVLPGDVRFLVLKRNPELAIFPGLWTVPGGGVRLGDLSSRMLKASDAVEGVLECAIRREIAEECGREVCLGKISYRSNFAFIQPNGVPVIGMRFSAPYLYGKVELDLSESTKSKWVTFEEARTINFIAGVPEVLEQCATQLVQNHDR